jgi:hypothetical protein
MVSGKKESRHESIEDSGCTVPGILNFTPYAGK